MSKTFTVKQVAEMLGYSTNSIYTFLQEGRIKGVRVGKGRFRIPEEEIQRILKLTKKEPTTEITTFETESNHISPVIINAEEPLRKVFDLRLEFINLFDWFLGVASILLGFSLFLYNKYNLFSQSNDILAWIGTLQISLIAGGAGLLITDVLNKDLDVNWRRFFQSILVLSYLAVTVGSYFFYDGGGVVLFGIFTLVLIANLIFTLSWVESFLSLVILPSVVVPLLLMINSTSVDLPVSIDNIFSVSFNNLFLWLILNSGIGLLLWLSHRMKWRLFWLLIIIYGSAYIYFSLELASELSWTKTFFLLLMGITCITFPLWEIVFYFRNQGRRIVSVFFVFLLFIFITNIGVIWVMEQNIREYAIKELNNKAIIGKVIMETVLSKVESTLSESAFNPLFIEAVKNEDSEKAMEILKLIFRKESDIRRMILANENGEILSVYPFIKSTANNLAFREYFIEAKRTKKIYFSDTLESKTEPKLISSVVAIPIIDGEEVIGVFVAALDLDSISKKLQQIANPQSKEYFSVNDRNRTRIMHADKNLVGTRMDSNNIIFSQSDKAEGLGESFNYNDIRTFQAFQSITQNDWTVQIQAPVIEVLKPTSAVSRLLLSAVVGFIIFAGILILILRKYMRD